MFLSRPPNGVSMPKAVYVVGISALWYLAGAEMIAFLVMAFVFAKRVRATKMISQPEMLEIRYTPVIRPLYSIIWVFSLAGYAALSFLVFNEFLQFLFGVNQWVSALICFGIVIAFQWVGGYAATVYADYIQGALILIGSVILGIFSVSSAGGMGKVVSTVPAAHLSIVGMGIGEIAAITIPLVLAFIIEPTLWIRVVSSRSLKEAQKANVLAFIIYIPICICTLITGLAAYVLYPKWEESLNMIAVDMADKLFPEIVTAVIFVGIIAALISSFNAFMTAANLNLSYDFIPSIYKAIKKKNFPEDKYRFVSRIGMIIIAITGTFIALWLPSLVEILQFSGALAASGLFLPVFCMFYIKKANTSGAIASFAIGSGAQLVLFIFNKIKPDVLAVDPFFISFPLALIALIIGTLIGKNNPPRPEQLAPFVVSKDIPVE
jgi:SSS family solute:Na+ symporter